MSLSINTHQHVEQSSELELEQGFSSHSLMARSRDISFGNGSPIICKVQSPSFTCKSSFSSFLPEPVTPFLEIGGFSFHSSAGSCTLEFSTPILALPSFAFFKEDCTGEQETEALDLPASSSRVDVIPRGILLSRL